MPGSSSCFPTADINWNNSIVMSIVVRKCTQTLYVKGHHFIYSAEKAAMQHSEHVHYCLLGSHLLSCVIVCACVKGSISPSTTSWEGSRECLLDALERYFQFFGENYRYLLKAVWSWKVGQLGCVCVMGQMLGGLNYTTALTNRLPIGLAMAWRHCK